MSTIILYDALHFFSIRLLEITYFFDRIHYNSLINHNNNNGVNDDRNDGTDDRINNRRDNKTNNRANDSINDRLGYFHFFLLRHALIVFSLNYQKPILLHQSTPMIGPTCNVSNMPCEILQPCQNHGTCNNTNMTPYGYQCLCPADFSGINCETSYRPCEPNPCWNDGTQILSLCDYRIIGVNWISLSDECHVFDMIFNCTCALGW
jgi:hypothetical protein